ncbi:tRNA (adenosine(37)-N6)-threonylcarbamoyltransferase complex transferase subunit TsaD [Opitutaceae bacterium TAV4]|nr:tRNA (adenosine(37)-N6)-threonylcarbamoyltransferase complex transferase subunit TsaD [Opitutaceae bacterium TAV4]RRK00502.1 tRNA (adenosine(37)-N6)-threonylcarbamoyltransferase complex transferase subunit TsaD [Opitutaceae bacterium TAV3]
MILAIETSCDETAVALFDPACGLAGEWVHSQIALHEKHGGVVPDLATREHLRTVAPLLERARQTVPFEHVSRVAVTHGPGLAGCLAIGVAAAKSLALALRVPLTGVNHLRGHVFSPFITLHSEAPAEFDARLSALLPHLALVVSGGNTLLAEVDAQRRIRVLSTTRDDAAGEALDKGAKLLALGYPGGPLIEKRAAKGRADAFDFPRGIGARAELDFSFSGLKTSLRYQLEKMTPTEIEARMDDLCASYQQAVVDALARKAALALDRGTPHGAYRSAGLSGGVANNQTLRAALARVVSLRRIPLLAALPRHTGDNAGMIAFAAWADPSAQPADTAADLAIAPGLELA